MLEPLLPLPVGELLDGNGSLVEKNLFSAISNREELTFCTFEIYYTIYCNRMGVVLVKVTRAYLAAVSNFLTV